jgi:hypothetical protein
VTTLDDLVPVPIQRFTSETLESLRTQGKCEGLYFEFKAEWKPEDVTRCVGAFANAAGGFLFFGIATGSDGCIDSMPGLEPGPEYPLLAKDRIVGHLSPLPVWDAVSVASPGDSSRPILAIRIEASPRPPHVVTTSGKHYIRTPSACDPITDRATLDHLFARAQIGQAAAERRAEELVVLPVDEESPEGNWTITIIAVPDPYLGDGTHGYLIGHEWRERARELFTTQGVRVRPRQMLESGVLVDTGGGQELVAMTDGAIRARWTLGPGDSFSGYPQSVPAAWLGSLIDDVLRAQARLRPTVLQSRLSVLLSGVSGMSVITGDYGQVTIPSPGRLPSVWSRETLTLTEEPHAGRTRMPS